MWVFVVVVSFSDVVVTGVGVLLDWCLVFVLFVLDCCVLGLGFVLVFCLCVVCLPFGLVSKLVCCFGLRVW